MDEAEAEAEDGDDGVEVLLLVVEEDPVLHACLKTSQSPIMSMPFIVSRDLFATAQPIGWAV